MPAEGIWGGQVGCRSGGAVEGEVAKQLFPDQESFKRGENRRWELTANHWDLPIHAVNVVAE